MTANDTISLQLATWAPRGNGLAYVYQNNIYYRPEAEVAVDYQITDNGVFEAIYNGVPDWVYEGELLPPSSALLYHSWEYHRFNRLTAEGETAASIRRDRWKRDLETLART